MPDAIGVQQSIAMLARCVWPEHSSTLAKMRFELVNGPETLQSGTGLFAARSGIGPRGCRIDAPLFAAFALKHFWG
jgi:hypothetical protein